MLMQTGRTDSTDTNFRAESNYVHNSNSYRLIGRYLYSESNRTVSTDRTEGSLRWRHELDKKWFYQTLSSYLSSKTKGLDHDVEQNLGLGYRIINTSRTSASIGAGLTGQYRDIHNSKVGKSLLGEFFQDLVFKYNPHLEFGEDFVAQYSPSGRGIRVLPNGQVQVLDTEVDNYRFSFKAFARGKFTESLSLSLRYEYEYDNPFATNNGKAEQRIITSLGYSF
jgi:putative salt-induced outer membrane protein YdiY